MIVVAPTILTMLAPYTFTSHFHNYNWFIILFFEIWAWDFINTSPFNNVVQWILSSILPSSLDVVPHSLRLTHCPFGLFVLLEFPFKLIVLGSIFKCLFPSSSHLVIQMCGHMFL
jgi:hypothetical protein